MELQTSNQSSKTSKVVMHPTKYALKLHGLTALHHSKVNILTQVNRLCFPSRILPTTITKSNIWVGKNTKRLFTCFTRSLLCHCYTYISKKNSINSQKTKSNFPAGAFTYKNYVTT